MARKEFCIATSHGYVGDCHRTMTAAHKELAGIVRRSIRRCRRRYKRCSQLGTVREGSVEIRIGGRQGYNMWERFAISRQRGFYGTRQRRRRKRRR